MYVTTHTYVFTPCLNFSFSNPHYLSFTSSFWWNVSSERRRKGQVVRVRVPSEIRRKGQVAVGRVRFIFLHNKSPKDGGLRDFYHNWTNSILQQMKWKFWKIADPLFQISWMTKSFKYQPRWFVLPLQCRTRPSKLFKFPQIVRPPVVERI
jgi:hypothetical protein